MWGVCFHCGEQIQEPNAYHIIVGHINQINQERDVQPYYSYGGEHVMTHQGSIRTTMEVVAVGNEPEQIIKSFHRECWLVVAGKEYS